MYYLDGQIFNLKGL